MKNYENGIMPFAAQVGDVGWGGRGHSGRFALAEAISSSSSSRANNKQAMSSHASSSCHQQMPPRLHPTNTKQ